VFVLVVLAAAAAFFVARDPGQATFIVRGLEVRTSVAAVVFLILLLALMATAVLWIFGLPRRMSLSRTRRKREKGVDALENAMLAAAAGDPRTARREARRAQLLLQRDVAPRLIAAQAAEQMGDLIGAESQFAAMLGDPRTVIVGRRGLAAAALSRRDFDTAILHAAQAFDENPAALWAFDLLFDAQVRAGRWEDGIETLGVGARRKHLPDDAARRRRAVLLAAAADELEIKEPSRARDLAEQAASLSPAFAPAAALAARLLLLAGKSWRAASLLEDAWTAAPHPAIVLAYRDLKPDETEKARTKRMAGLIQLNAEHRESRILAAEQALAAGDGVGASAQLAPLVRLERDPSARLCGLFAQAAQASGDMAEARRWVAQAALAAGEPDWSDLDPEGPAFAYTREDWARLVYSFGDTGQLIHPRHERFERQRLTAPTELLLEGPDAGEAGTQPSGGPAKSGRPTGADVGPVFYRNPHAPDDPGVEGD